jgi:hypothetical protein
MKVLRFPLRTAVNTQWQFELKYMFLPTDTMHMNLFACLKFKRLKLRGFSRY